MTAQVSSYLFAPGSLNYNSSKITISSGQVFYRHTKFVGDAGEQNQYSLELNFRLSLTLSNNSQAFLRINFSQGISTYGSSGYGWGPQQPEVPYNDLIQFNFDETIDRNLIHAIEFQYQQTATAPNPLTIDLHSSFTQSFDTKLNAMGYNITLSIIHQNEGNTTAIGSYSHNNIIYYNEIITTDEGYFPFTSPLFVITSFVIMIYYKRKYFI